MPDNFDENMSIDEINELFEDVIEMPDEYRMAVCAVFGNPQGRAYVQK